jgi:hypothetical protein
MLGVWVSTREQDRVKAQFPHIFPSESLLSAALALVLGTVMNQLRSLLPHFTIQ